jgi:hypothetical protein
VKCAGNKTKLLWFQIMMWKTFMSETYSLLIDHVKDDVEKDRLFNVQKFSGN